MMLYPDIPQTAQRLISKRLEHAKQDKIAMMDAPPTNKDIGEGGIILAFDSGNIYMYIKVNGVIYKSPKFEQTR